MEIFKQFLLASFLTFIPGDLWLGQHYTNTKYIGIRIPRKYSPEYFHQVVKTFSRIRDYYRSDDHNQSLQIFPKLIVSKLVAEGVNATLLPYKNQTKFGNLSTFPKILYDNTVSKTYEGKTSILSHWKDYYNSPYSHTHDLIRSHEKREFPMFSIINEKYLNFFYCDEPRKTKTYPFKFSLFTNPFDSWIWIILLMSFASVVLILTPNNFKDIISKVILLLNLTLQQGSPALPKYSGLCYVWMIMSMVVVTFYSGEMTSTVIRPPEDDVIRTVQDLIHRSYRLSFVSRNQIEVLNNSMNSLKLKSKTKESIELLVKTRDQNNSLGTFNNLLYSGKLCLFNWWENAMYIVHWAHKKFKTEAKTMGNKVRICRVGQELLRSDELFFVTLPPDNAQLTAAFHKLFQVGVIQRWMQEEEGLLTSGRVQERVRVVSRTKVKSMEVNVASKLKLQGKIVTVFSIWLICALVSIAGFGCEIFFHFSTRQFCCNRKSLREFKNGID